jgi:hypothetical protein
VGVGSPVASSWCDVLSTTRLTHIACPQEIPRCIRASRNKNRSSYSDGCKQSRRGYTGRVLCEIQEAIARFFQKCASAVFGSKYSARSTRLEVLGSKYSARSTRLEVLITGYVVFERRILTGSA